MLVAFSDGSVLLIIVFNRLGTGPRSLFCFPPFPTSGARGYQSFTKVRYLHVLLLVLYLPCNCS